MARSDNTPKKGGRGSDREPVSRIELIDVQQGEERPHMAVYAVDRSNKQIFQTEVNDDGGFDVPEKIAAAAHRIMIGPAADNVHCVDRDALAVYRSTQFRELIKAGPIQLPKPIWNNWVFFIRCVTGSVRHCFPYPWIIRDLVSQASLTPVQRTLSLRTSTTSLAAPRVAEIAANVSLQPAFQILPFPLFKCEPVCDGVVEVYRRTCCCRPWIVRDPRIPELIDRLEDLIPKIPEIKWPPRPEPDPTPFGNPLIKDGALDELALNARKDLQALRSLPEEQKPAYIQTRRYLWCLNSCGAPIKVAQGTIHPDGEFRICWRDHLRLLALNCHDEYAYVVKQHINGVTVTIYNGLTAGIWYHYGQEATLTSYHPKAQGCRHNDFPGEGAFALLQDIGLAGSYRLETPAATGWDRVAPPAYNSGLADPVALPADAVGKYKNRNWGGGLRLRYHFSEAMRAIGARYYRISVAQADAAGNPTGDRTYLNSGLSWRKYVVSGTDINVETELLGPVTVGAPSTDNLFTIPYDADGDWQSGQYHGVLDTTEFANGRFLLTLEVFNAAGERLRPQGLPPAAGAGVDAPFTYRRWETENEPTAEVPFAGLTHMLWWDNRKAEALIVDLRKNNIPSSEECQFLEGAGAAQFSVGYRAYHPEPIFLLNHSMWWRRGLGGPVGYLESANPSNVGQPPAPVGVSNAHTFAHMLGPQSKCSFSLNLHVNVKTFNGIGTLNALDDWDNAAFALEQS